MLKFDLKGCEVDEYQQLDSSAVYFICLKKKLHAMDKLIFF